MVQLTSSFGTPSSGYVDDNRVRYAPTPVPTITGARDGVNITGPDLTWVDDPGYEPGYDGFHLDAKSGQAWTPKRGWHTYDPGYKAAGRVGQRGMEDNYTFGTDKPINEPFLPSQWPVSPERGREAAADYIPQDLFAGEDLNPGSSIAGQLEQGLWESGNTPEQQTAAHKAPGWPFSDPNSEVASYQADVPDFVGGGIKKDALPLIPQEWEDARIRREEAKPAWQYLTDSLLPERVSDRIPNWGDTRFTPGLRDIARDATSPIALGTLPLGGGLAVGGLKAVVKDVGINAVSGVLGLGALESATHLPERAQLGGATPFFAAVAAGGGAEAAIRGGIPSVPRSGEPDIPNLVAPPRPMTRTPMAGEGYINGRPVDASDVSKVRPQEPDLPPKTTVRQDGTVVANGTEIGRVYKDGDAWGGTVAVKGATAEIEPQATRVAAVTELTKVADEIGAIPQAIPPKGAVAPKTEAGPQSVAPSPAGTPKGAVPPSNQPVLPTQRSSADIAAIIARIDEGETRISPAWIQRHFGLGYVEADRIMKELEVRGVLGAADGYGVSRPVMNRAVAPTPRQAEPPVAEVDDLADQLARSTEIEQARRAAPPVAPVSATGRRPGKVDPRRPADPLPVTPKFQEGEEVVVAATGERVIVSEPYTKGRYKGESGRVTVTRATPGGHIDPQRAWYMPEELLPVRINPATAEPQQLIRALEQAGELTSVAQRGELNRLAPYNADLTDQLRQGLARAYAAEDASRGIRNAVADPNYRLPDGNLRVEVEAGVAAGVHVNPNVAAQMDEANSAALRAAADMVDPEVHRPPGYKPPPGASGFVPPQAQRRTSFPGRVARGVTAPLRVPSMAVSWVFGGDMGIFGRNVLLTGPTHPKRFGEAAKIAVGAYKRGGQEVLDQTLERINRDPLKVARRAAANLPIPKIDESNLTLREEAIMWSGGSPLHKSAQRATVAAMAHLRANIFDQLSRNIGTDAPTKRYFEQATSMVTKTGETEWKQVEEWFSLQSIPDQNRIRQSLKELEGVANWTSHLTGRGTSEWLDKAAPTLQLGVLAPRLYVARAQVAIDPLVETLKTGNFNVGKAIAKDYIALAGTGLTLLGAMELAGFQTFSDPLKPLFGRVKIGEHTYDLFGGWQDPIRIAVAVHKVIEENGGYASWEGWGNGGGEVLYQLSNKMTPIARMIYTKVRLNGQVLPFYEPNRDDIFGLLPKGVRDFLPDPVEDALSALALPLFLKDIADGWIEWSKDRDAGGLLTSIVETPLIFFGGNRLLQSAYEADREKFKKEMGYDWDSAEPAEQERWRQAHPITDPAGRSTNIAKSNAKAEIDAEALRQQEALDHDFSTFAIRGEQWRDRRKINDAFTRGKTEQVYASSPDYKGGHPLVAEYFAVREQAERLSGFTDYDLLDQWEAKNPEKARQISEYFDERAKRGSATEQAYSKVTSEMNRTGFWDLRDDAWTAWSASYPSPYKTFYEYQAAWVTRRRDELLAAGIKDSPYQANQADKMARDEFTKANTDFYEYYHQSFLGPWVAANPTLAGEAHYKWELFTPNKAEKDAIGGDSAAIGKSRAAYNAVEAANAKDFKDFPDNVRVGTNAAWKTWLTTNKAEAIELVRYGRLSLSAKAEWEIVGAGSTKATYETWKANLQE